MVALDRTSRALVRTADGQRALVEAVVRAAAEHVDARWLLLALAAMRSGAWILKSDLFWGSTMQPIGSACALVALAWALRSLGQDVRLCVPPDFRGGIERLGMPVTPIGPELRSTGKADAAAARPTPEQRRRMIEDTVAAQFATIAAAAEGCDVMVGATALQIAAPSVAEQRGIPYVVAAYCPAVLPSPHHAPPVLAMLGDKPAPAQSDYGALWLQEMVDQNQKGAQQFGFHDVPALKKAVAREIRGFVHDGGFLFAMCTATATIELALAAERVDIAAAYADGTPMDPDADAKLDWSKCFAFHGAHLEQSPAIASFSDIDGHQVNNPGRRQPLGAYTLFNFSAKIDPVPTMLVQCHKSVIPGFYGLTTSFMRNRLKSGITVLADEPGAPWVKYIHGDAGKGTWTYFGGHDPEDPQHQIGDPPTDLSLHPNSPGYRLILNNVLFPAAKKRQLKT